MVGVVDACPLEVTTTKGRGTCINYGQLNNGHGLFVCTSVIRSSNDPLYLEDNFFVFAFFWSSWLVQVLCQLLQERLPSQLLQGRGVGVRQLLLCQELKLTELTTVYHLVFPMEVASLQQTSLKFSRISKQINHIDSGNAVIVQVTNLWSFLFCHLSRIHPFCFYICSNLH